MVPQPLFYLRGTVYRVKFPSDEKPGQLIDKFALCLQEGRILQNRVGFVGILLTTCKNNDAPRVPAWKVYISPGESRTEFGVLADCGQIYTVPISDVLDTAYTLSPETMKKIDHALQFGVGILRVEDFKR
jgi:mRNA-degrading endonuclease toxin of MazEF toxin-antitoxin module